MRLEEYLKENHMSQKFFSEKIGVSIRTIHNILHQRYKPSLGTALKIEQATKKKVSFRDLLPDFIQKKEGKEKD
jgi:DNA-binding XRE family transcriptional regulator